MKKGELPCVDCGKPTKGRFGKEQVPVCQTHIARHQLEFDLKMRKLIHEKAEKDETGKP